VSRSCFYDGSRRHLERTRMRKMTEMKKESDEVILAILRARVALLTFTPGLSWVFGVDVDVPSDMIWLSSKIPPSEARPWCWTAFSLCCSFRRNLIELKVGRVMIHEKCWMDAIQLVSVDVRC
jgi:hypothetical protein